MWGLCGVHVWLLYSCMCISFLNLSEFLLHHLHPWKAHRRCLHQAPLSPKDGCLPHFKPHSWKWSGDQPDTTPESSLSIPPGGWLLVRPETPKLRHWAIFRRPTVLWMKIPKLLQSFAAEVYGQWGEGWRWYYITTWFSTQSPQSHVQTGRGRWRGTTSATRSICQGHADPRSWRCGLGICRISGGRVPRVLAKSCKLTCLNIFLFEDYLV